MQQQQEDIIVLGQLWERILQGLRRLSPDWRPDTYAIAVGDALGVPSLRLQTLREILRVIQRLERVPLDLLVEEIGQVE